jgi:hypothetical protein
MWREREIIGKVSGGGGKFSHSQSQNTKRKIAKIAKIA